MKRIVSFLKATTLGELLVLLPVVVALILLTNAEHAGAVKSGLLSVGTGAGCIVFVTEDHRNGKPSICIPETPNTGTGTVKIISKELVRPLHVRIANIAYTLQQWGVGSAKLLEKHGNYWDGRPEGESR